MRICRKCSKQVSDDSKICRDCGAILEDIPDASVPETGVEWEPVSQAGSASAAEPHEAGLEEADEPSVGDDVVESEEPALPDSEESAWKCPQCGEIVPGTFDVCWKCLTTKDGEKPDQGEPVVFQEASDVGEPGDEPKPTEHYAEALGTDKDKRERPRPVCPRCGSSRMMLGVTICDQGEGSGGTLNVVICGDPSALIFKDRLYGELKADICGDCGHVELRVRNPKALYRHYRKSLGLQDDEESQT